MKHNAALISLAAGIIFTICGMVWWMELNRVPKFTEPSPALLRHNAYDDYVAAIDSITGVKDLDKATGRSGGPKPDFGFKQIMAQLNAKPLAYVKKALQERCEVPPTRAFIPQKPSREQFLRLARLIRLEGELKSDRGDNASAADIDLDGVQYGIDLSHGATFNGMVISGGCQYICRRPLWTLVGTLSARSSLSMAKRMEGLVSQEDSFPEILREETRWGQAGMAAYYQTHDAGQIARYQLKLYGSKIKANDLYSNFRYSRQATLDDYAHAMETTARIEDLSYFQSRRATREALPPEPDAAWFVRRVPNAHFYCTVNDTENGLLMTMFALRAFRLEKGTYPPSLAQLVPRYLDRLPGDPFAASGCFQYRSEGASYRLYSVGPDGVRQRRSADHRSLSRVQEIYSGSECRGHCCRHNHKIAPGIAYATPGVA